LASVEYSNYKSETKNEKTFNIKGAFAYRNDQKDLTIFNRLDFISQNDNSKKVKKLINNFYLNYFPNKNWELGMGFGIKYIKDYYDLENYDSYSAMISFDLLYHYNQTLSFGAQIFALKDFGSKTTNFGAGLFVDKTIFSNGVLRVGINYAKYSDSDFNFVTYKNSGIYLQFRIKFDQEDLKPLLQKVAQ
jgi:hypothetical protein